MRSLRWMPALAVCTLLVGCGGPDVQANQAETLRAYQPRFTDMRHKLAQVKSLLPAKKVGKDSCATTSPLHPKLEYRVDTGDGKEPPGNTELLMEEALTNPDADLTHNLRNFAYEEGTKLLAPLRWTGPRGLLGEKYFTMLEADPAWNPGYDRELRAKLDSGLNTQYLVVLRPLDYRSPDAGDGKTSAGSAGHVLLNGFVVNLPQHKLLCQFTAEDENSGIVVVVIPSGENWERKIYRNSLAGAGYKIAGKVESLTGGTVTAPRQ